jgi:hypothetical protein
MSKVEKIIKELSKIIPDRLYINLMYFRHFHRFPNLKDPQTFNEKLQWLKLYDRRSEYTTMVDKYLAKEYVANIIGEEYIIPTIDVWNTIDEIDWDSLPNQFVLKWNHDSGSIVICKDKSKLDKGAAIKILRRNEHSSGYWYGREWPYKNVKPCIIAEQYMEDEDGELKDFKFFSFDGETKAMFVATDRFNKEEDTKFDFYDTQFNHMPFTNGHPNATRQINKPQNFDLMIQLASKLSKGYPHIRVDFYEVNGKVYFGELTLYHWSGFVPFNPPLYDKMFGDWIKLPSKNN